MHTYFASCPRGLEEPLAGELVALGADNVQAGRAGVSFSGGLEIGYLACFWCRSASRVLLQLGQAPAATPEALYAGVQSIAWNDHFRVDQTFSVSFNSVRSQITHTNFGALKSKDAIVDQFRSAFGRRPNVSRDNPAIRIDVHIEDDLATVGLDLSGTSLHRRTGQRVSGAAPMKENLAAGLLLMSGWPDRAREGAPFVDFMCGAGTLPVEAALMACDTAPGLLRNTFGFEHWKGHDRTLLRKVRREAALRDRRADPPDVAIVGWDNSQRAIEGASANVRLAGLEKAVSLGRRELALAVPQGASPGLVILNPPYGERLGAGKDLKLLYRRIGMTLKSRFTEWTAHLLTGNLELAKEVGLRASRRAVVYNGPLECRLLEYRILPEKESQAPVSDGRQMFSNRLAKNLRKLKGWLRNEGASCYRVYDKDLPEYAVSIDRYEDWLYIREDERPDTIDPLKGEARLHEAAAAAAELLSVAPADVYVRQRGRQRGTSQYDKVAEEGRFREVSEGGLTFLVNPADYLDTGLFLDHRITRRMIREMAGGKDFLNLFSYTGSATVYAAGGGAASTTTVDMSATYLDWARENMLLNGFEGGRHEYVRSDVLQWVDRQTRRFDLIFLDPPTFSTSKSMKRTLEVQRDHVWLLTAAGRLLKPGGVILFSNNFRRFKMSRDELPQFSIEDITQRTIPPDFSRDRRVHNCWLITKLRA